MNESVRVRAPRRRPRRGQLLAAGLVVLLLGAAGCGNDDAGSSPDSVDKTARAGRDLAGRAGCTSCHSTDGSRKLGPTWQGLAGSEVELRDGTTVVADRSYLEESITTPTAKVVDGFPTTMPKIELSDEEVDQLVAYIESLGDGAS